MIFLILILITISCSFFLYLSNNKLEKKQQSIREFENDICLVNYELNISNSGVKIPDMQLFFDSLSNIMSSRKKPILVLRIKGYYCNTCIDSEFKSMEKMPEELKNNTYLFVSNLSRRLLKQSLKKHNLNLAHEEIPLNILEKYNFEKHEYPYYFLLHEDMRISHIFIPDKQFEDLTIRYFNSIKRWIQD